MGRQLPAGTVTFLFTDVEGSTRLIEALGDQYRPTLEEHRRVLREAVAAHDGHELRTEGDGCFLVFAGASQAVAAALDGQLALASHRWEDRPVRVRMGVHTGEAELTDGEYYGLAVHEAARISAAAHGGQTLVSRRTKDLITALPPEAELVSLGEHRLKDIAEPVALYEIGHPRLQPVGYARTAAILPNNLPPQLTSFIGRRDEVGRLRKLLEHTRLLTITGAGGAGKTRLALKVGEAVLEEFRDGVWLVELASITDPGLVWSAFASAFGVTQDPARTTEAVVLDRMRDRTMLLVVDNCEHLIEPAAAACATILRECGGVRIMATSREPLTIEGEAVSRVSSLTLPDPDGSAESMGESEAVRLFRDRAEGVSLGFEITDDSAAAVAEICRRLDGMPLAIELAAARVRAMTPQEIARRLDDRFKLLSGGSRTGMRRQQTLRAAIDWSYELLSEPERVVFRRCSVFVGGFTLDPAESICTGGPIADDQVVDLVTSLVDRSLVVAEPVADETRYRLLESTREYAREALAISAEAPEVWTRHLGYFAELAEEAEPKLYGGRYQRRHVERFERELGNIRQAMAWAESAERSDTGLRLASALWWFWWLAGRLEEGEDALERLSANGIADPDLERRVAVARGLVSFRRGSGSEPFLGRFADDASSDRWTGEGLHFLAWTRWSESRHDEAIGLCERACTVLEKAGETQDHAQALDSLARMLTRVGRPDEGRRLFEQAIVLFERGDDPGGVGLALTGLADLEEDSGHYARAFALWQDGLDRIRRWGTMPDLAILLVGAAGHAVVQADYGAAEALCDEATRVYAQLALNPVRARCQLAWIFTQQGKYEAAHEVLGSVLAGEYGEVVRSDWRHIAVELAIATGDWDKARREAAAWEIAVSEAGGDGWIRALSGFYSAQFAWLSGDFATAADALTLYVAEVRDRGSNRSLPAALCWLGQSLSEMGRFEDATDAYREALDVGPKFYDNLPDLISLFERIAELLIQTGRARQACTILAAGSRIRADIGTPRHPWQEARHENALSAIRRSISESAFAQAWDEGDSMTIDDAVPCVATALLG